MQENRLAGFGGLFIYLFSGAALLFVLLPLAVIVSLSFSAGAFATFPPRGFTFGWYQQVVQDPEFVRAFVTSTILAAASTVCACALGLPAAYALNRWDVPGGRAFEALLLSPMIVPILIIGLALLQFFSTLRMGHVTVSLFIGHLLVTLPYMVRTITASLKLVDRSLEEAASTLGGSPLTVFRKVTVPQIVPGIAAGSLFTFMVSFDDFPISMWLSDAETVPLPILLHHSMNRVFDPSISSMSSLMILTGVVVVFALEKIVGLRKAMGV